MDDKTITGRKGWKGRVGVTGRKDDSHGPRRIQWRKWYSGNCSNPDQTAIAAAAPVATTSPSQTLMGTLRSSVSLNLQLSDFQALLFLGALFLTGGGGAVIGSDL